MVIPLGQFAMEKSLQYREDQDLPEVIRLMEDDFTNEDGNKEVCG